MSDFVIFCGQGKRQGLAAGTPDAVRSRRRLATCYVRSQTYQSVPVCGALLPAFALVSGSGIYDTIYDTVESYSTTAVIVSTQRHQQINLDIAWIVERPICNTNLDLTV
jgi:predicted small integral membrane protein